MHSGLSLAKATLLLSELRGSDGQPLYLLTQKLLQQQVSLHLLTLVQSSTSATSGVSTFVFFFTAEDTGGVCCAEGRGRTAAALQYSLEEYLPPTAPSTGQDNHAFG